MDKAIQIQPRLTRSRSRSLIGGVCAGLSDYFGMNLTFIRLLFILFSFSHGIGVVFYLILFAVTPAAPSENASSQHGIESSARSSRSLFTCIAGLISVFVGLIGFLANIVGILEFLIK